jgi:CRP-like cAMP-binding protein
VAPSLESVEVKRRDLVWQSGSDIPFVYFPETAMISVVSTMKNGSTAEVGVIGRDGMSGIPVLLGARVSPCEAFVQVPGAVLRMPSPVFLRMVSRNRRAHDLLLRYAYVFLHQISRSAACNLFHTVKHRCAKWLLMTFDRVGKTEFQLSQEFLAQMLGSRRAGVAAAALEFKREGMIEYQHGRISIRDAEGLKRFACECYLLIRLEAERILDLDVRR